MSDSRNKKDKNQHIQVFVRVRPPNSSEKSGKSCTVVDVPSNKEVIIKERPQDKLTKKFTFDKVFGPNSKQIEVYDAVVNPLVAEVLAGYNCTVFAYGQTGTGKTFTMEGVSNAGMHWKSDTSAGIIPRTLSHLFDELRVNDAQEYTVRVSFLELYNEELFDLLSPSDDASKIRLFEDASKKGSVIIHGLEEVTVHNKNEVYNILEKGSERRQTAATLMNAHSSRSHTVFSITIHIKENTVDGEELLKTGKMNLVDLAGSENVGRSGAVDRRAREAGNINQSLLTLGRVITALVERAPHVPYRESKLTRLLQESLGGRTKTSIIATISPSSLNLEETLSTLDYAHRAKNITNRPEINQKMSKKALLKEYTEEIERLRRDLAATRERNGVYIAQDNYNEMQTKIEYQDKEIEEKINHIKALEETMEQKEKIFNNLQIAFETQKQVLQETEEQLLEKKQVLKVTKKQLNETKLDRDVQKHLVEKHVITEETLLAQAHTLVDVADLATSDVSKLHDKIGRKKNVEEQNEKIEKQFRENISFQITHLEEDVSQYIQNLIQFCLTKKDILDSQTSKQCSGIDASIEHISRELPNTISNITTNFIQMLNQSYIECNEWLNKEIAETKKFTAQEISILNDFFPKLSTKFRQSMENKLSENIESIKSDLTQKLAELANKTNKSVQLVCEKFTSNYDELLNEIQQIDKLIQQNFQIEKQKLQEREDIYNELNQVFTKMKELNNQFSKTMTRVKSYNDKDVNQPVSNQLQTMSQMYHSVSKKNKLKLQESLDFAKNEEGDVQENIKRIKLDVGSSLEQIQNLAENTKEKCNDLVSEMETEINHRVNTIGSYQNTRETNGTEFGEKLLKHKDTSTMHVEEVNKVVQFAGINHKETMEDQRVRQLNACHDNKHNLESKCVEMNEWRTQISTQLHTTKHQIDKFLLEDLRRDQPTGTTPVRKEFSYPRSLVTTSPHENIMQRFKESIAKKMSNSEDESIDELNGNSNTNYQTPSKEICALENDKNKVLTSTPKTHNTSNRLLIRSMSSSDTLMKEKDTREIKSFPDIELVTNNDKENGEDGVVSKKPQFKRISRFSQISRKVLGSSN